MTSWLKNVTK